LRANLKIDHLRMRYLRTPQGHVKSLTQYENPLNLHAGWESLLLCSCSIPRAVGVNAPDRPSGKRRGPVQRVQEALCRLGRLTGVTPPVRPRTAASRSAKIQRSAGPQGPLQELRKRTRRAAPPQSWGRKVAMLHIGPGYLWILSSIAGCTLGLHRPQLLQIAIFLRLNPSP
jgi:hypothetical protein